MRERRSDQPSLRLPLGFVLLLCAKQETHNTRSWAGQRERSARAAAMEAAFDVGSHDISDPSEAQAEHIPVKKLSIGTWNLLAKYDEHVLLSFYWAERKLVWEVLHLGVVRKMEVDFEDIAQITHSSGADEMQPEKLTIELHRPPRFFKENPPSAVSGGSQEVNYVYTTDFTNGQASTESRHLLLFDPGAITRETAKMLTGSGIRLVSEGAVMPESAAAGPSRGGLLRGAGGVHATSAHLRQPPTSSPRLDAILLQDQLKREMRERQARYTGICPVCDPPARMRSCTRRDRETHTRARALAPFPTWHPLHNLTRSRSLPLPSLSLLFSPQVRERIYAVVFDELIASVTRDQSKRGSLLRRVYAEARMTIDGYKSVFEASIQFGSKKLTQGTALKGDLAEQIEGLEGEIANLKKEVSHLESLCEGLAFREAEKAKEYEETAKEVIDLQAEQQQLQDLLVTLRPSKPEKGK
jgi:hypothetical protein